MHDLPKVNKNHRSDLPKVNKNTETDKQLKQSYLKITSCDFDKSLYL